jgi:hypothetical protein
MNRVHSFFAQGNCKSDQLCDELAVNLAPLQFSKQSPARGEFQMERYKLRRRFDG